MSNVRAKFVSDDYIDGIKVKFTMYCFIDIEKTYYYKVILNTIFFYLVL
jgi:hypothetical protein